MAYDLEEQEQLASLQAFWNKYGNILMGLLIVVFGSYAAYNYYKFDQRKQAVGASTLYSSLQTAAEAKDNALVQRTAGDIENKFKGTTYAQMAALAAAKSAFEAGDLKTAKAQLQWVISNGSEQYQPVAKLRLAGVLLDEKAYDEAMKLVSTPFAKEFAGAVADRKGDILVAQNKLADARSAYLAALEAVGKQGAARGLIELKLEAIGGTVPKDAEATAKAAA